MSSMSATQAAASTKEILRMRKTALPPWIAALVYLACTVPSAQGQIWFVNVSGTAQSDKVALETVGVYREGPGFAYEFEDLILGSVTAVNIPGALRTVVASADGYPLSGAPDGLLNDQFLNTGLFTPGLGDGNFQAGDEFVEYTFDQPVVNGPGSDVVLSFITFDFGDFESPPGPYWLMPGGGTPTQIDRDADVDLTAVEIVPAFGFLDGGPTDPSDFLTTNVQQTSGLGNANATPRPSLHLIDLTELGIALDETILSLRIWDDDFSNGNTIYVMTIAGFPAVPEPSTGVLALLGALGLWFVGRRRRNAGNRRT
jgi:hypothetical protein